MFRGAFFFDKKTSSGAKHMLGLNTGVRRKAFSGNKSNFRGKFTWEAEFISVHIKGMFFVSKYSQCFQGFPPERSLAFTTLVSQLLALLLRFSFNFWTCSILNICEVHQMWNGTLSVCSSEFSSFSLYMLSLCRVSSRNVKISPKKSIVMLWPNRKPIE